MTASTIAKGTTVTAQVGIHATTGTVVSAHTDRHGLVHYLIETAPQVFELVYAEEIV